MSEEKRNKDADTSGTDIASVDTPARDDLVEKQVVFKRVEKVQKREAWVGWTQVVANVAVPVTLLAATYSFWQESTSRQMDASGRQIAIFYDEGLSNSRQVLFDLWTEENLAVFAEPRDRTFIDETVEAVIEHAAADPRAITSAIVNLASYFDRVEACISNGSCHEGELVSQLGNYGRDFFCLYSGQLDRAREVSLLSVGYGASEFAARSGGCE